MVASLEALFPGLRGTAYSVTSPSDIVYNCVAWAVGDVSSWWWPDADGERHWPAGVTRAETLAAFGEAFASLGYSPCDSEAPEPGAEKVALFTTVGGVPRHAARQLPNGRWTSKLGSAEDIEHELHALAGDIYGSVVLFLKRPLPSAA